MAAMGAILQFNEGASSKHLVMENAGISCVEHSAKVTPAESSTTSIYYSIAVQATTT